MERERRLLAAGTLIGDEVINAQNEHVGKIEELMISVDSGRIGYVVMSFGGILGFGNKFFAIPWSLLRVDQQRHCFVTNLDKEMLKNAPGFDKDHWPDAADPYWEKSLTDYYKKEKIEV